ncbi:MAG: hypothetical protein AVDCRST_MAG48-349, partial [uncultured Friedmanniella sp.]
ARVRDRDPVRWRHRRPAGRGPAPAHRPRPAAADQQAPTRASTRARCVL